MSTISKSPDESPFQLTIPAEPDPTSKSAHDHVAHATNGNGTESHDVLDALELKSVLEALLFVSHEPVTMERLAGVLSEVSRGTITQALRELQAAFEREQRGVQIVELAGGFQMVTRPEHGCYIKRLEKSKAAPKLSRSALESLAIIAYKQPIVRAEIEHIRGVETSGVLRTLLERKLVRIVGRKDVPGRPIMYATTQYFQQHFGLKDLSELPPLREFKELGEAEQALLSMNDDSLVAGESESVRRDSNGEERDLATGEADLSAGDPVAVSMSSHSPEQA